MRNVTRTHAQNDRQSVRPGPRKVVRDGGEIERGCRTCARIVQVHHAGTETGGHAQVQRCSSITVLRIWIRPSLEKHLRWPSTLQGNFFGENRFAAFSPFAAAKKTGARTMQRRRWAHPLRDAANKMGAAISQSVLGVGLCPGECSCAPVKSSCGLPGQHSAAPSCLCCRLQRGPCRPVPVSSSPA